MLPQGKRRNEKNHLPKEDSRRQTEALEIAEQRPRSLTRALRGMAGLDCGRSQLKREGKKRE